MKHLAFAARLCLPVSAFAYSQRHADYIVSQTVTENMFRGSLTSQRPLIVSAIENDLREENLLEAEEPSLIQRPIDYLE